MSHWPGNAGIDLTAATSTATPGDVLHAGASTHRLSKSIRFYLEEMDAAKRTVATYFPFIMDPGEYMFMKPEVT